VRSRLNDGKLAEIFVQSYQNPLLLMRMIENFIISRVLELITGPDYIVPCSLEHVAHTA